MQWIGAWKAAKYQVEVSATDLAVEFACPVEKALPDFQRIYDSRLGYSLAVPDGWYVTDLQRGQSASNLGHL